MQTPKSRTCLLLVAAFAVSLCACSRPNPGIVELQSSREAVRAAKSWRAAATGQFPGGQWVIVNLISVECPGRFDRVALFHDEQNKSVHEIWFDGTYYNKTGGPGVWTSLSTSSMPFGDCDKGPELVWDGYLYDDLDAIQRTGEIRRGAIDKADGVSCTWWELAPVKGAPPHYSVCVGVDDHLPRTVRSHEHNLNYVYSFSGWNSTSVSLPADMTISSNQ